MLRLRPRGGALLTCLFALDLLTLAASACGGNGAAPTIDRFSPGTAGSGRQTFLLISGNGFHDGARVTIGGRTVATRTTWINTQLAAAVLPQGIQPGEYSVELTNPDGQRAVSEQHLFVHAGPAPSSAASATETPAIATAAPTTPAPPARTPEPPRAPSPTPHPSPSPSPEPSPPPATAPSRAPSVTRTPAAAPETPVSTPVLRSTASATATTGTNR